MVDKRKAFTDQRNKAKGRGIDFEFKYREWCGWWRKQLGADWHKKRGRLSHQYVMARNEDVGPYAAWNVHCTTSDGNRSEYHKRGKTGHTLAVSKSRFNGECVQRRKLNSDQVLSIFDSQGTQKALAREFGISERMVRLIKNRQIWPKVLADSPPQA